MVFKSKQKGAGFEREVCKKLSLWVTKGKLQDVFWRSAMSGGRATFHSRKGVDIRQGGDITAVAPEGNEFASKWFVECKFVRDADLGNFLFKDIGITTRFWDKAVIEARRHFRDPMLIIKSHHYPIVVLVNHIAHWVQPIVICEGFDITLFDSLLAAPYARDS